MDKKLGFDKIKENLTKYLQSVLEVYSYKITMARQLPDRWLINVNFKEGIGEKGFTYTAAVSIDSTTGELIEAMKYISYASDAYSR